MKYIILLVALTASLCAHAQERHFYGKVVDKNRKDGIPFCTVKVKDRNEGVYTDENGRFAFSTSNDSVKAFIFSSLGYAKAEIPTAQFTGDSMTVELQKEYTTLKEAVIIPDGKLHHKTLGRKKAKHIGGCYQQYGEEDAVFLHADKFNNGYLKEVFVYITDEGAPDTKFRIHVYEKDPETNKPGKELTDSNLIVHANTGNEWVKADMSAKRIPVGSGVFISVEWIAGHGNTDAAMRSEGHSTVINDNGEAEKRITLISHNGQVLGLARNTGVPYMYHRSPFNMEWGTNWGKNYNPMLCPMIYGTYSYVKKKK